jgi:hypothetical protein
MLIHMRVITHPPPPIPAIVRAAMSISMLVATPQRIVPRENADTARRSAPLRPTRSLSQFRVILIRK